VIESHSSYVIIIACKCKMLQNVITTLGYIIIPNIMLIIIFRLEAFIITYTDSVCVK
jgi:hypothetical protein